MIRLAVVGDVHLAFGPKDVEALNASRYDHVLFVGDLGGYSSRGTRKVAHHIAKLTRPTLVMPGNHDAMTAPQLLAEVVGNRPSIRLLSGGEEARIAELRAALGPAELTGYRVHAIADALSLVAARPHSFGGPRLSFAPYLERAFGVTSMEASATRLCGLIDETTANDLVLFGHNGPTGLGARRNDLWGADFKRDGGDFGDPDLRVALDHARARGKRVIAVIAGHMHRQMRGGRGGERVWRHRDEHGTLFVNAARVPRVFRDGERSLRHHVAVTIDGGRAEAEDVLWPG